MAYTALPTFITGDLFTAANANVYWRDNFAAGAPGIFTAAGDLHYATGASAGAALAIGDAGQVLSVNSGGTAPEWDGSFVGCGLSSTDLDLTRATVTKISFDTENYDTSAFFSTDNTDAVTTPFAGVFQCSGVVTFDATTDGEPPDLYVYVGPAGAATVAQKEAVTEEATVISFCYTNRFGSGYDACLSVAYQTTGNDYTTDFGVNHADYQVTWLGTT